MRFDQLRVKISSLAAEGRIIRRRISRAKRAYTNANNELHRMDSVDLRHAESRALREQITVHRDDAVASFWSMKGHNVDVGQEARCAQLALAFLRGRAYSSCEQANTVHAPDWGKVFDNAKRFSPAGYFDTLDFQAWMSDAIDHLRSGHKEGHAMTRLHLPIFKKSTKAELEKVRAQPLVERLGREIARNL
jgi:hypothetical protein